MALPAAAQVTILLTAGTAIWLRAANKDVQQAPGERHELIITKNRTVAADRLRYAGQDFTIDNPETYFSTEVLEVQTRRTLSSIKECLDANHRCRILLRAINILCPMLIMLGIVLLGCGIALGVWSANGASDTELAVVFIRILYVLGPAIIGVLLLEACMFWHGREYENSRARSSIS